MQQYKASEVQMHYLTISGNKKWSDKIELFVSIARGKNCVVSRYKDADYRPENS